MKQTEQPFRHGGDWETFREVTGRMPLDFSASLSPLGVPDGVRRAAEAAAAASDRYPDPDCRALRRALAAAEQVPAAWCLCGAGAADLIYRVVLAQRPARALVPVPTFSEYTAALTLAGAVTERHRLQPDRGFRPDASFLEQIRDGVDLVFLCTPNNPTGCALPRDFVRAAAERCRDAGALLVLDECFLDFLEDRNERTFRPYLEYFPNVLLLKAFTKLYAMAGLRLGYGICSNPELLSRMRAAGPPWAVSTPAQAAGIAALKETGYAGRVRRLIAEERPWLERQLTALGAEVVPGEANFLLFREPVPLSDGLRERGILIRSCADAEGPGPGWYRCAVRTHAENEQFISAMREVLQ